MTDPKPSSDSPIEITHCGRTLEVTNLWFREKQMGIWERYVRPELEKIEAPRYLELGVCEGQSMTWMMEAHEQLTAIGVDPFVDPRSRNPEHFESYRVRAMRNLRPYLDGARLVLSTTESQTWLCAKHAAIAKHASNLDAHRFDIAYIDGDHAAAPALVDMLLAWRLLRPGGLMILDDCQRRWAHARPGLRAATNAFLETLEDRYYIVWREPEKFWTPRSYGLRKRKDRGWL